MRAKKLQIGQHLPKSQAKIIVTLFNMHAIANCLVSVFCVTLFNGAQQSWTLRRGTAELFFISFLGTQQIDRFTSVG